MEDLNIQGMMKNKNLSFKIANASWNRLAILLEYKSRNDNKIFRKSYRFYPSTKTCNNCKTESDVFKGPGSLSIREWTCKECGTHHDRDINAAKNIRDWEPISEGAISRTIKMKEKLRKSQLRDFTNWIIFSKYLDILKNDKTGKILNLILKLSNIETLTKLDEEYIMTLIEKDKNRKNKKYELANNKIKELKRLKPVNQLENEINIEQLNKICLRLETQNIK